MILETQLIQWFINNRINLIWTGIIALIDLVLLVIIRLLTIKINKASSSRAKALTSLVQMAFKILTIVISAFIILAVWGIDTTIGIVILCTILVIIGLGARDIISDVFRGMSNIFANLYEVGEIVKINDFKGKVINITVTKVQIQSITGEVKTVTSNQIKEIVNYSRSYTTAIVDITISNYKDIVNIQNILEEKLPSLKEEYSQILEGPIVNGIESIDNGNVTLRITARTTADMDNIIKRAIRKKVIEVFNKHHFDLGCIKCDVMVNKNE